MLSILLNFLYATQIEPDDTRKKYKNQHYKYVNIAIINKRIARQNVKFL
jgi:hypothetical protein